MALLLDPTLFLFTPRFHDVFLATRSYYVPMRYDEALDWTGSIIPLQCLYGRAPPL